MFESPPQYLNRWEVPRGCGVRVDNATGRPLGLAGREGVALKPFLCLSEPINQVEQRRNERFRDSDIFRRAAPRRQ